MAITPPSDIVLDVARAADPEKYKVAVERLARMRAAAATTETLAPLAPQAPAARPPATTSSTTTILPFDAGAGAQRRGRLDAYGQFESFVLQSFIQSMLPKNAHNVFGKGSAGEFWKSMLAEKMGDELARSGQVGIARRLAAGPSHAAQPESIGPTGPSAPPPLASTVSRTPSPGPGEMGEPRTDATVIAPGSDRS